MIEIFGNKNENEVSKLCLCNIIDPTKKPQLIFDFSNLELIDFYIDNYSLFHQCIFNENTKFKSGTLKLLESETGRYNFKKEHFNLPQVLLLEGTEDILQGIENQSDDTEKNNSKTLEIFLRKFYNNGRFQPKKVAEIKSKQGHIVDLMLKQKVIIPNTNSKLNEKEYQINPEYKVDFSKFLETSIPTVKVSKLIKNMWFFW